MTSTFKEKYGPWALITGASKGLGLAFAHECAGRGLNTVLIARGADMLNEQAGLIRGTYGVKTETISLDLSREDILDIIVPVTDSLKIGLVINNAASESVLPFLDHTLGQLLAQINLNTRAAMLLSYHFAGKMVERKRGGIIFVSSASALLGTPYAANYAGTKAYNLLMGESLWYELERKGIDVLGFMPGLTKTPGLDEQRPKLNKQMTVMDADETAAEALAALGNKPSLVAGRKNRFAYFIMGLFFSRARAIRLIGKINNKVFGPFK